MMRAFHESRSAFLSLLVSLPFASVAFAQDPDSDAIKSTAQLLKDQSPLPAWGLAAFFLIACLAIAFKNSKRSHLD